MCTAALVLFCVYEAITGAIDWWMALVITLAAVLGGCLRYGYWMMVLEERERKKAAKKSGQIPI
jgi:membrane protein YqaA with SNARE-associated domain